MNKIWLLFIFLFFDIAHLYADDDNRFAYKNIPESLLKHADAVVRERDLSIYILSLDRVKTTERYAVTILNKEGYSNAIFKQGYDQFTSIDKVEGVLYDKDGNEVKRLKKRDIKDAAYFDFNFFTDDRYKYFDFNYAVYPFTVVFEIEQHQNYSVFLPNWKPQDNLNVAVERATLNVQYAKELPLRYKSFHIDRQPAENIVDGIKTLQDTLVNIPAQKEEDMIPQNQFDLPEIIFATDSFSFGGLAGKMDSWQGFGKFFYDLNDKRDILPDNIRKVVHQLTDTCKTERQKIALLYKYLQDNNRYVSIQLGIGGWQSFDALYVAEKGYGDCKALSNYMKSLLKEAGIKAYATLVYGGRGKIERMQKEFPYNAFNHVIVCVPLKNDTVWIECTAKDLPAGYLSSFTADRDVLVLTESGGRVIRTPAYKETENIMNSSITLYLADDNAVKGNATLFYEGNFDDEEKQYVGNESREKIINYLNGKFSLPSYKINNYKITDTMCGLIPAMEEQLDFTGSSKVTATGKRVFVTPGILPINTHLPASIEERNKPFHISSSYQVNDTETIRINGVFTTEYIPADVNIINEFGEYKCKTVFENGNMLKVIRHYQQKKGTYPKGEFQDYVVMSKAVNNGVGQKQVVFLKKE